MKLFTLVEIELRKILPIALIVFCIMLVGSIFIFNRSANIALDSVNESLMKDSLTLQEYIANNGTLNSFDVTNVSLLMSLFVFSALILMASSLYLWFKEWFGASKRIYLLLTLNSSRINIIISKLIAIILVSFIYYGVVLLSLFLGSLISQFVLSSELYPSLNIVNDHLLTTIQILVPLNPIALVYNTLFVSAVFLSISVFVLFNRSPRKVAGSLIGLIYCIIMLFILIMTKQLWLFSDERMIVDFAYVIASCLISFLISRLLIKNLVTV
jgi:hypothetical protein